jgi:hypothetical protein
MVRLDTSVKSFRLDADGQHQPTAVDLISGETYVKVAPWMPWKSRNSNTAEHHADAVALAEQGAHDDHSDDEHFRGVWIPLEEAGEGAEMVADAEPGEAPTHRTVTKKAATGRKKKK